MTDTTTIRPDPTSVAEQSPDHKTEAERPPDDSKRWWALGVIAAATLLVVLDATIATIALPHAVADLGIADAHQHWVLTAYTLAFGGLLLFGGRLADVIGRKLAFMIGLAGFAASSAAAGLAVNGATLFGARAVQGAFAALLAPAALSLVTVIFVEQRERAKAFGVYGAVQGSGAAVGLLLGGALTEYASWRWCLFISVPIAAAAIFAAVATLPESRTNDRGRLDVIGASVVTAGLASLVYAFTIAAERDGGWTAAPTISLLAGGVLLLALFVIIEQRSAHPLLPLRLLHDPSRAGVLIASVLLGAAMFGALLFLTLYFQVSRGFDAMETGLAFLPFSGAIIIVASSMSRVLPRFGPKPLMTFGLLLATLGSLWLTQVDPSTSWLVDVLPGELMMSLGLGLVFVPLFSVGLHGVDESDTGVISGALDATQQVGGALGVALLNSLYTAAVASRVSDGVAATTASDAAYHGYRLGFAVSAGVFAVACAVVIALVKVSNDES